MDSQPVDAYARSLRTQLLTERTRFMATMRDLPEPVRTSWRDTLRVIARQFNEDEPDLEQVRTDLLFVRLVFP